MTAKTKLINPVLALILTIILVVPAMICLDLLASLGEAQLYFIRTNAEGPATPFNFVAKIALWLTDFVKVWVVAFLQATVPIFISFWLFSKWKREVF